MTPADVLATLRATLADAEAFAATKPTGWVLIDGRATLAIIAHDGQFRFGAMTKAHRFPTMAAALKQAARWNAQPQVAGTANTVDAYAYDVAARMWVEQVRATLTNLGGEG